MKYVAWSRRVFDYSDTITRQTNLSGHIFSAPADPRFKLEIPWRWAGDQINQNARASYTRGISKKSHCAERKDFSSGCIWIGGSEEKKALRVGCCFGQ